MDKRTYIAAREVDTKAELKIREEMPIADIIPSLRECLQRVGLRHPNILVGFICCSCNLNWCFRPRGCENSKYGKPVANSYQFLAVIAAMWRERVVINKKESLEWYSIPSSQKFFEFSHTLGRQRTFEPAQYLCLGHRLKVGV